MSGFIRVRAVAGPKHEFYAAAGEVAAHPDLYDVIDKTVVSRPLPVKYVTDVRRTVDTTAPKPVGDIKKENE